jgi:hypothetical protein
MDVDDEVAGSLKQVSASNGTGIGTSKGGGGSTPKPTVQMETAKPVEYMLSLRINVPYEVVLAQAFAHLGLDPASAGKGDHSLVIRTVQTI